jgi:hypothetical protein
VLPQPSKKTSFIVLGAQTTAAKLAAIEKHKLTTIKEDELLEMIRSREKDDDARQKPKVTPTAPKEDKDAKPKTKPPPKTATASTSKSKPEKKYVNDEIEEEKAAGPAKPKFE